MISLLMFCHLIDAKVAFLPQNAMGSKIQELAGFADMAVDIEWDGNTATLESEGEVRKVTFTDAEMREAIKDEFSTQLIEKISVALAQKN